MLQMFFLLYFLIDSFKETQRSRRVSILLFALLLFSCKVVCDSFAIPWTVACQVLCPWYFPGKNTEVGYHFFLQGNLPNPGIEPASPALQGSPLFSLSNRKKILEALIVGICGQDS